MQLKRWERPFVACWHRGQGFGWCQPRQLRENLRQSVPLWSLTSAQDRGHLKGRVQVEAILRSTHIMRVYFVPRSSMMDSFCLASSASFCSSYLDAGARFRPKWERAD